KASESTYDRVSRDIQSLIFSQISSGLGQFLEDVIYRRTQSASGSESSLGDVKNRTAQCYLPQLSIVAGLSLTWFGDIRLADILE
ncbi:hypothetical protein RRG08_040894, partial [Elysia crispata]